jgi:hypothetical protein
MHDGTTFEHTHILFSKNLIEISVGLSTTQSEDFNFSLSHVGRHFEIGHARLIPSPYSFIISVKIQILKHNVHIQWKNSISVKDITIYMYRISLSS